MDYFQDKNISPMLIAQMQEPFDDPEWIYELKPDGLRCIAYNMYDGNKLEFCKGYSMDGQEKVLNFDSDS